VLVEVELLDVVDDVDVVEVLEVDVVLVEVVDDVEVEVLLVEVVDEVEVEVVVGRRGFGLANVNRTALQRAAPWAGSPHTRCATPPGGGRWSGRSAPRRTAAPLGERPAWVNRARRTTPLVRVRNRKAELLNCWARTPLLSAATDHS
jgi:hypothetical protein